MTNANLVVAHFRDGTVVKGATNDFFPNRPAFHVTPSGAERGQQVRVQDLKALFFVKHLEGDPLRVDLRGFIQAPQDNVHGRKIALRFHDGELVCGYSLAYASTRDAFFMFPADPNSNNQRIFVVVASATEVREGAPAEKLAQRTIDGRAA